MPWKKPSFGYLSPAIEIGVRRALAYGESYESLELRFANSGSLLPESWAFWSSRVPKGLDEASLQRWIYGPFPIPQTDNSQQAGSPT